MRLPVLILSALLLGACAPRQIIRPVFEIQATKPEDQVAFTWKDETAYFDIESPDGIGEAYIVRTEGDLPKIIVLRFHLRGLESLQVRFDTHQIQISVSSQSDHTILERARLNQAEDESSLTSDSEYWIPIEIISETKAIPLTDGYFQVLLPRAFYAAKPREFSIEWIDFYR
jgi:hypothetical protein